MSWQSMGIFDQPAESPDASLLIFPASFAEETATHNFDFIVISVIKQN